MQPVNDGEGHGVDAREWRGREVVDNAGNKIGVVAEVFLDDDTDQPEWVLVDTGLRGSRCSFVPLEGAVEEGRSVRVAHAKDKVADAPHIEADEELSAREEKRLYRYYGRDHGAGDPIAVEGDVTMTRSEEELSVGTEAHERGRTRLRKHVVTEQVTRTVPVRREVAHLDREAIEAPQSLPPAVLAEDVQELMLSEEEVVVEKRVVPMERVRLEKDVITEERRVEAELRKEQIEVEEERL